MSARRLSAHGRQRQGEGGGRAGHRTSAHAFVGVCYPDNMSLNIVITVKQEMRTAKDAKYAKGKSSNEKP
jgi:hypothetical protein